MLHPACFRKRLEPYISPATKLIGFYELDC